MSRKGGNESDGDTHLPSDEGIKVTRAFSYEDPLFFDEADVS